MSASRLPVSRRVVAAVASSALVVGGVVVAATASAASACPTYTDVAGDAAVQGNPLLTEKDTDIVEVSHSVDAGIFSTTMKLTALDALGPNSSNGDTFSASFSVAGKKVVMAAYRDFTPGAAADNNALMIDAVDATVPMTTKYDVTASTVTMSVTTADLAKAVGSPLDGLPFTAMSALTGYWTDTRPATKHGSTMTNDTAAQTANSSYVFGGSCSGEAAPTTAGSATPTASASASPTPTATSSASPTPTASATPTGSPTPTPTPTETANAGGLFDQPRKSCVQFADPAGDASTNPASDVVGDTDDDLDIINVVYKTTPTALQAYVKATKLDTAPSSLGGAVYDTHSFSAGFTLGGKVVVLTAGATGPATATVGGVANTTLQATAKFDTTHSNLVFSVPLASLATLTGHPAAGAAMTALTASSSAESSSGLPGGGKADSAAPTTDVQKTYVVGDNTCFLPPAGKLFVDGLQGVYTDASVVTGSLQDVDGADVSGATLTLKIPGLPTRSAITNATGDAVFRFRVTLPAGSRTGVLGFSGSPTVGAVTLSEPFVVAAEKTVLKAVGAKGVITATLTDNDRSPLVRHTVVFTVGKKVTRIGTNAKGQAVLRGLAKGAVAKVTFATEPGRYSAAKPVSAKAL
jgi:hypothetical protein